MTEIDQDEFMNNKHRKVCTTLNYIQHFFILISTVTGCIWISAFASLLGILIEITSSAIWLKLCSIASGIKKYKPIITKKTKHGEIIMLAKTKLNILEDLISKSLIDSYINNDECFSKSCVKRIGWHERRNQNFKG